nr:hypothetical protein HUO10_004667 [Paraburkholderia busanensis]
MKAGLQFKQWARVAMSAMLFHVAMASAQTVDIPLGTPEGFSADAVTAVGNGRYCISGNIYDDSGPSWSGMAVMVDATNRRVLWRTPIPFTRGYAGNSVQACGVAGQSVYVVSVESTQSSESLKQKRVVLNRLSAAGKLEKQHTLHAGFDEWFYMLGVNSSGLVVAGSTSEKSAPGGPFGNYVAQFDGDLVQTGIRQLPSGAFGADSSAVFDGRNLVVAGQFLPNPGAGHDGYAVSKIDFDKNRYLWSTYTSPGVTLGTSALVAQDGNTVVVSSAPGGVLNVTVLDRLGKIASTFAAKAAEFCKLQAAAMDGHKLSVFGDTCKSDSVTQLLSVDLTSHAVSTTRAFKTNLQGATIDAGGWVGVAVSEEHGAVFQRGVE